MTNAQEQVSNEGMLMAIEVSEKTWRVAFLSAKKLRIVDVAAWNQEGLWRQVKLAREKLGLGEGVSIRSCYEAGRCGFSLHRFLEMGGVKNVVVDPASIEVNRRKKHKKTDRLDAEKLVRMLARYHVHGEAQCWRVCHVPSAEQEEARRLDREYERLKKERTAHLSRIRSLLALHGVRCTIVRRLKVDTLCDWSGQLQGLAWREEIRRELDRLALVDGQLKRLTDQMKSALKSPQTGADRKAAQLHRLKALGPVSSTALSRQFFGWRTFANRRQVGAATGLVSCPYDSGDSRVDQGISKAGPRRIRMLAIELGWMWVRHQPGSALTKWFIERFSGSKRLRRIGIVALARKLMVALWKYLEFGTIPEGAALRAEASREAASRAG